MLQYRSSTYNKMLEDHSSSPDAPEVKSAETLMHQDCSSTFNKLLEEHSSSPDAPEVKSAEILMHQYRSSTFDKMLEKDSCPATTQKNANSTSLIPEELRVDEHVLINKFSSKPADDILSDLSG